MQFIKPDINIDFLGRRNFAFLLSAMLILMTFVLLIWKGGPNYGVDFSGGVLIQVRLDQPHTPSEIRDSLRAVQLQDSIIQEFGEEG